MKPYVFFKTMTFKVLSNMTSVLLTSCDISNDASKLVFQMSLLLVYTAWNCLLTHQDFGYTTMKTTYATVTSFGVALCLFFFVAVV